MLMAIQSESGEAQKHLLNRKSTVDGRNLEQNTREYRVSRVMLVHMTTTEMNLRDPRS